MSSEGYTIINWRASGGWISYFENGCVPHYRLYDESRVSYFLVILKPAFPITCFFYT